MKLQEFFGKASKDFYARLQKNKFQSIALKKENKNHSSPLTINCIK